MLCASARGRTWDRPSISRVLYQLSYACTKHTTISCWSVDSTKDAAVLPLDLVVPMVHRGNTREPKRIHNVRMSTLEDKLRRHKNKRRVWRRCITRLARLKFEQVTYDAASLKAAS